MFKMGTRTFEIGINEIRILDYHFELKKSQKINLRKFLL